MDEELITCFEQLASSEINPLDFIDWDAVLEAVKELKASDSASSANADST